MILYRIQLYLASKGNTFILDKLLQFHDEMGRMIF